MNFDQTFQTNPANAISNEKMLIIKAQSDVVMTTFELPRFA